MPQDSNIFLSLGKPVKDEYGRLIGEVVSFTVKPNGEVEHVYIRRSDGAFTKYPAGNLKFNGSEVIYISDIKAETASFCDQIPLIWRKDQALKELYEKKKISPEVYEDLHNSFEGALNQLKTEAQALLERIDKEIERCNKEIKELNYALVHLEVEHEIGEVIGAGIYVVVGIAAGYAGSALAVSMILAALVSVFTALSFCELTAWQPKEGSIYEYSYQLISPFAGFLTGWMWVVSNTFAGAAVALGFASYLHALFPVFPPNWTAALLCLFFTAINFVGVRQSALFNNVLVVAKLLILGFFVIYGLFHIEPSNFADFNPFQMGVLSAAFYIFFAYGGFARAAVVAEEVKDARKNVPRAILLSLLISTAVYVLVGLVAVGLVGASRLAGSNSPLTEAISITGNAAATYTVSAGGLIATASVLLTAILGVSRMMYAMARRGDMPQSLGKLHPAFNTPHYAVWIVGAAMTMLVLFVDLTSVVAISTFALLFDYTLANIAALKLKTAKRNYPKTVSALGAATCLTFLAITLLAKPEAWIIGIATLIAGTAYHQVKMKFTKNFNFSSINGG